MFGLSFKLTRDDLSPTLSALARAARNPEPVLRAMGTTFKSITEGAFNSVGAAYRPLPWKAKRDGSPSILQSRHPTMSKAFHMTVGPKSVTVSNPMPYAGIHQFGGKTKAHRIVPKFKKALSFGGRVYGAVNHPGSTIPARPFFPVDASGQMTPKAEQLVQQAGEREIRKQLPPGVG